MTRPIPTVSIGMPAYNGAKTLGPVLDALLVQSFMDFEIIISDNASTDRTATICAAYAARDDRIRYIRQSVNLGAMPNFRFVLEQARGRYFLWAAADDLRSPDFLEENVRFLDTHPDYVASASPNCFEGQDPGGPDVVTFALEGNVGDRFRQFFDHCWKSHGIFYALIRTDVLRGCTVIGDTFLAADWAIILYLASRGNIHRTEKGMTVSGLGGVSSRSGAYRAFRNRWIEWLFPLLRLSYEVSRLSAGCSVGSRLKILWKLAQLNLTAGYGQLFSELYQFYCANVKPRLKRSPHV